jgi:hypothetical protein
MRVLFTLVLVCIAGCTAGTSNVRHDWQEFGYARFSRTIDELLGPGAVDCGYLDLIGGTPSAQARASTNECLRKARAGDAPFKYATVRLPIDSYAHEVFARTRDGTLWMIVYDIMVDGDAPQQWNQVCQSITVDRRTLMIRGEGCVEKSYGALDKP